MELSLPLQFSVSDPAVPAQPAAREGPVYLVDGHSLTFKAYYAIRGLTAPGGAPIGAVYGFLRMLLRLIEDRGAGFLAVVFDTGGPTFREALYPEYKAHREAPPADFSDQMKEIYVLLAAMGIATYHLHGFEADDLIATMARTLEAQGSSSIIVSADKDLFQLVDGKTRLLRVGSQEMEMFDEAAVEKKLGIRPAQVADWLAIVGDTSDNIPGVPGIGEKGAAKLLQQFESLDDILSRAELVKNEKQRESLRQNAEQARLSLRLATVATDVPLAWKVEDCRLPESLWNAQSIGILARLGFDSLLKEKGLRAPKADPAIQETEEKGDYRIISDEMALREWVGHASGARWLALDTETTDVNPMLASLVGVSLSVRPGEASYIPVSHRAGENAGSQIPLDALRTILNPLFSGSMEKAPSLTAHHAKYDWKILERAGFKIAPARFDTMLASFVLDPGRASGHGLKPLGFECCGVKMRPIDEIIGAGKNAVGMDELPAEAVFEYACMDADVTMRLTEHFEQKLAETPSLEKLFREIEIPLIPVLQKMEMGGFAVDLEVLQNLGRVMNEELERLCKEIWEAAGRTFNIESPRQVAQLLFEDLKLPPGKRTKTGYSTDTDVLESLEHSHPVVKLILEYRGIAKLKSTYADALPREIHPQTRRIHSSFSQTIAQTGRLSSSNPNLQNIPIRSRLGREIRRTFVPDQKEHILLSADYSQIELRILAHFSGDAALRRAYAEGKDIHALTASRVFGVAESEVNPDMRAQAKVINFGIIYGMSAHGLSQRLGISRQEAARFIEAYFAGYPDVRKWMDLTLERARTVGYVETLMGRRRRLPDLTARNGQLRSNAERIAINTPIQGTSADMIKIAMIQLDGSLPAQAPGARMVCQVHDELVFSVPRGVTDPAGAHVRKIMSEAMPLDVPIVVDLAWGENWAEC